MRRRTQGWYRSKNAKLRKENIIRRSRKGVLARETKRLAAGQAGLLEREPKLVPFHPLQLGVRDKLSGDEAWIDFRSVRDATRRLALIRKFYQPGCKRP